MNNNLIYFFDVENPLMVAVIEHTISRYTHPDLSLIPLVIKKIGSNRVRSWQKKLKCNNEDKRHSYIQ